MFQGSMGHNLAGRMDLPIGPVRAYALFAHCFTCSKDIFAAKHIASELSNQGIAVLRFDFTGLGSSQGEFANTNFSSNIEDLLQAVAFMRASYQAPAILIGHSLGGAAVLSAAHKIPEAEAVVTIGAPSDVKHVLNNFEAHIDDIKQKGEVDVQLTGRSFKIKKQFIDDLEKSSVIDGAKVMNKALMIMHSPIDDVVGIENAGNIFVAAKHPKSFISLDKADHLLTNSDDAIYVAKTISAWVMRFVDNNMDKSIAEQKGVVVKETGQGKFQNLAFSGKHHIFADEPVQLGGLDSGPGPYDFLAISLAACTSMTLRMYATFKKIDLGRISVEVNHNKIYAKDCQDCLQDVRKNGGKIDHFERIIYIESDLDEVLQNKVLEIADKCPVHKTLENRNSVATRVGLKKQ